MVIEGPTREVEIKADRLNPVAGRDHAGEHGIERNTPPATTVAAAATESSNPVPENGAVLRCMAGERPTDNIPSGATTGRG
jgi:hypothetical protein